MPTVTTSVPPEANRYALPLLRTPKAGALFAIITSPDLIGLDTHFWKGHTMPCEAPNCEACEHGMPTAWHGYIAVFNPASNHQALLEFTPAGGLQLEAYRDTAGTLRGANLKAERAGKRANGRLQFTLSPSDPQRVHIPDPPDLIKVLAAIWRLPAEAFTLPPAQRFDTTLNRVNTDLTALVSTIGKPNGAKHEDR